MSHLDEWAHLIAKQLKSEAELVGAQAKSELYEDVAQESFIRVVLEPFLPGSYQIGSGRVIDSFGNISSPQDIVIYRNDYPQINMPGSHHVFIYESVLATIQVSSKLVRKSLFNALDRCASMGELDPVIEPETMRALAAKMSVKLDANQQYVHSEPLNTNRFNLIGRPQSFIYAFTGYQTSEKQLAENLSKWIDHYHEDNAALRMKSLPSVIATQGCFAWRNTAPFTMNLPALMGIGNDQAPLRLIILQLMHALNRRLQNTSDGYGVRSNIAPYLMQFERPEISKAMGKPVNPGDQRSVLSRNSAVKPIVANQQKPRETLAQPAQVPPVEIKEKQKVPKPKSTSNPTTPDRSVAKVTSSNKPDHGVEKPVQPANKPASSAVNKESEQPQQAPVIEDRSRPRQRLASPASELSKSAKTGSRPSSPLSLYGNEGEGEADEYEFQPIEPPRSQSSEGVDHESQESVDDDFESTQKIDLNSINNNTNEGKGGDIKAEPLSNSKAQSETNDEEVDQAFMDTLVEKSEVLAQDESKPAKDKPGYVKEMLI